MAEQREREPAQSELDLLRWTYRTAWSEKVPIEAVSKVLTLVRRLEREATS